MRKPKVPNECRLCTKWCLALYRWMEGFGDIKNKCLRDKMSEESLKNLPKYIAGILADSLADHPFADYGMTWTWDELWDFINRLRELAGEPPVEVVSDMGRMGYKVMGNNPAKPFKQDEPSPEMKEHIEKYHDPKGLAELKDAVFALKMIREGEIQFCTCSQCEFFFGHCQMSQYSGRHEEYVNDRACIFFSAKNKKTLSEITEERTEQDNTATEIAGSEERS